MSGILNGMVAVVTGSGQGIGRALAFGLAEQGAKIVTNNRAPIDTLHNGSNRANVFAGDAETTAEAIRKKGGQAVSCYGDISDFHFAEQLIRKAVDTFGEIDILCNVAGLFGFGAIDEIDEELWDKVNSVKPKGYFNTMHFAVPYMKKRHYGRIINCTSRAFMGDVIRHAEYCAANAGVVGLTRAASIELWEDNITCNAFSPFARTRASLDLEGADDSVMIGGNIPPKVEETPKPEEFVPFLVYLASRNADKISGSVFSLGGNRIQMHQEPVVYRTMCKTKGESWTVEEICEMAPQALFSNYRSIADIEKK